MCLLNLIICADQRTYVDCKNICTTKSVNKISIQWDMERSIQWYTDTDISKIDIFSKRVIALNLTLIILTSRILSNLKHIMLNSILKYS